MPSVSAEISPDFVALQLALVDRFVGLGRGSWSEGVHQLTNLQRRLGLGEPTDPPSGHAWIDLLDRLDQLSTVDERLDAVTDALSSAPRAVPVHITNQWPTVGAFSVEVTGRIARTHFFSMDDDDISPLHPSKLDQRRDELTAVLAIAFDEHCELERVAGGSWLYSTRSYSSLFPAAHVATAVVRRGCSTFRGMSHWGQFVDHRGNLRPALASRFRHNVQRWTGSDPCGLFPIDTLEVSSPIAVFGRHR